MAFFYVANMLQHRVLTTIYFRCSQRIDGRPRYTSSSRRAGIISVMRSGRMAVAGTPTAKKETHVFNRDGLFGKKDEPQRSDLRSVNVTPGLSGGSAPARSQPQLQPASEAPKPDLRFAETPKTHAPRLEEPAGSRLIVGPDIKLKGVEI